MQQRNPPRMVAARDLALGDRIRLDGIGAWRDCIVRQIEGEWLTLFRPYGTTADFSYTGGVICYIGIEEFKIERNCSQFELLESVTLK